MLNTIRPLRKLLITLSVAPMLMLAACGEVLVHEEFEKAVMNKSGSEVTERLGKPTTVDGNNPSRVTWTYFSKTIDVDNGNKRDSKTILTLEPDATTQALKVVKVAYEKG